MRRAGHVACTEERSGEYIVLVGNMRVIFHWGDPGIGGKIILRWFFRKWDVGVWTGLIWLRLWTGGGLL